jgi:hypothetical protein
LSAACAPPKCWAAFEDARNLSDCHLFQKWHQKHILARDQNKVHTSHMRTNVNIADDARQFAEVYAHANGLTLGDAITDLIRKSSQTAAGASETPRFGRTASGFPTFPPKGRILTTEMVLKAQEEDFV